MPANHYRYNASTYTYEPVHVHHRTLLRRLGSCVLVALGIAVSFITFDQVSAVDLEQRLMAQQKQQLVQKMELQANSLGTIESSLLAYHKKDNSFYRSILGIDRIDPAQWNGGMGGTDKYAAINIPVQQELSMLVDRLGYQFDLQLKSFSLLEQVAEQKSSELKHIPAIRPLRSGPIASGFGYRHDPFNGHPQFHPGLDFVMPTGTAVRATGAGVVVRSGVSESGYGIQVEIDHGFGFHTKYAHLSKADVAVGDTIARDQVIGKVGSTGYSIAPHLHYEIIRHGEKVNPIDYFYAK